MQFENDKWECFLYLLDIVQLCTARAMNQSHAGYLAALIHDHHLQFKRCYPGASITPKMHYMVHFPQQIMRYGITERSLSADLHLVCRTGPLINTWCMRMEAKNSELKQSALKGNYKNVPFTVAKRHQHLLCANLQSSVYFDTQPEFGPGEYIYIYTVLPKC